MAPLNSSSLISYSAQNMISHFNTCLVRFFGQTAIRNHPVLVYIYTSKFASVCKLFNTRVLAYCRLPAKFPEPGYRYCSPIVYCPFLETPAYWRIYDNSIHGHYFSPINLYSNISIFIKLVFLQKPLIRANTLALKS